jgi:hypothetical protein
VALTQATPFERGKMKVKLWQIKEILRLRELHPWPVQLWANGRVTYQGSDASARYKNDGIELVLTLD